MVEIFLSDVPALRERDISDGFLFLQTASKFVWPNTPLDWRQLE